MIRPANASRNGPRVHPVIARVNHQLDAVPQEEVAHRCIALLGRVELLLRKLAHAGSRLAREGRGAARWPVRGDRHDIEPQLHQVAQIGPLPETATPTFR